ncbi:MAG: radical SAM protein, partial [Chloroherpetonaceae bacterium]
MKILMVYPETPNTFWGFNHVLKFISKKSTFPPLGLITVATIFPDRWEKKLIDMNVSPLIDKDILWADYVLISAMVIQKKSAREVIDRCKALGVKTIAGGPLFTSEYPEYDDVDHLLLDEGELTIPEFLDDLKNGSPKHIYRANGWADITQTPIPSWELVDLRKYATLNIQYSRGCPFNCEFCNITTLFGRVPRTKSSEQILHELDIIYDMGWRGGIFFVDDNFIGNHKKLKADILPALIQWMKKRKYPFSFQTEVSINLADDDQLMELMVKAGFNTIFVGIETISEEGLTECNKFQNKNRDMSECIRKMQHNGFQVQGGFIVGFDSDNETIFNKMIKFIQDTGIVSAMVGLLNAPKGTLLYKRLEREGRITESFSGSNTDINFSPKMNLNTLIDGYKHIINT